MTFSPFTTRCIWPVLCCSDVENIMMIIYRLKIKSYKNIFKIKQHFLLQNPDCIMGCMQELTKQKNKHLYYHNLTLTFRILLKLITAWHWFTNLMYPHVYLTCSMLSPNSLFMPKNRIHPVIQQCKILFFILVTYNL